MNYIKFKNLKYVLPVIALAIVLFPSITTAAPVNLIPNGSLASPSSANPAIPDKWNIGGYGNNDRTFSYPVAGVSGGTAARVDISSYTDGDAKWYFDSVPVTAGKQYSFQNIYMATVPTVLAIQYTDSNGTVSFANFASVPAASNWETANVKFTPSAGTVAVTIFHLLDSVGSLTVTNYSLVEVLPPTPFNQGFVSLTFDDGFKSQINNAKPILDASNLKSTFYIVTHASAGFADPISTKVLADTIYEYSDEYMSSSTNKVVAQVTLEDNSVVNADVIDATGNTTGSSASFGPASTWTPISVKFYIPQNAKTVTVIHSSTSGDPISVQKTAFGAENYMNIQDIYSLMNDGQEVGAHSQTHPDLTSLNTNDATTQIADSRQELLAAGVSPIQSFNYPYGASNSATEQIVQNAGFTSARTVIPGFNGKDANPFGLLAQSVNADTTLNQVQSWIDEANLNKDWLILVFHGIVPDTTNDPYASTPSTLQGIVDYLKNNNILVKTVSQGLALINSTSTPTPTSTPTSTPPTAPTTTTKTMSLKAGWNLITLPIQPINPTSSQPFSYTAETFGQLVGADTITQWLANQQYNTHVVGLPINDFPITNGMGFFAHLNADKSVDITGMDFVESTPVISPGWNLLGWNRNTSTTAETFGGSLNNTDVVSTFDSTGQQWMSHIMGLPLNNFGISQGNGVFVHSTAAATP